MTRVTVRNQSDFNVSADYLIIGENDVVLTEDALFGEVIIEFQGGSINLNGHSITFNNTQIIAPNYRLFNGDVANISGTLSNGEIIADWFGAAAEGECNKAVNVAIGLCYKQRVVMPSRKYYLNAGDTAPIAVDKDDISLICTGDIICQPGYNCACVIEARASRTRIEIRRMSYWVAVRFPTVSAVRISGDVYDSVFKVDYIAEFGRGLEFVPSFKGGEFFVGVRHCHFEWQIISCGCDVYFDFFAGLDSMDDDTRSIGNYSVEFSGNYFKGGRLFGVRAVYMEPQPSVRKSQYRVYEPTDNVFDSVGFERQGQRSITLNGCNNFLFKNCRLSQGELIEQKGHRFERALTLHKCRNVMVDNKSGFDNGRVSSYGSYNVSFKGLCQSTGEVAIASMLISDSTDSGEVPVNYNVHRATFGQLYEYVALTATGGNIYFEDIFPAIKVGEEMSINNDQHQITDVTVPMLIKAVRVIVPEGLFLKIICKKKRVVVFPDILLICQLSQGSRLQFAEDSQTGPIIKELYNSRNLLTSELFEL